MVADDDVIARSFRDVLAAFNLEAKTEPQEVSRDQPDCAIRKVGPPANGQQVGRWKSGAGHLDGRQSKPLAATTPGIGGKFRPPPPRRGPRCEGRPLRQSRGDRWSRGPGPPCV